MTSSYSRSLQLAKRCFVRITACTALIVVTRASASAQNSAGPGCFPETSVEAKIVLSRARVTASDPRSHRVRAAMGIPMLPAESIRYVSDLSKCNLARIAIDRRQNQAPSPRRVALVQLGDVYWVEDGNRYGRGGPFTYVLSGDLTRMLGRH
jgi:hypothetical protein